MVMMAIVMGVLLVMVMIIMLVIYNSVTVVLVLLLLTVTAVMTRAVRSRSLPASQRPNSGTETLIMKLGLSFGLSHWLLQL